MVPLTAAHCHNHDHYHHHRHRHRHYYHHHHYLPCSLPQVRQGLHSRWVVVSVFPVESEQPSRREGGPEAPQG
ncbi:hypothetical protein E2C01_075483 [Portunus trituberculatus]|uniref:Uncharacterized protein n=1 Tax=Portunus trituberculatus TaxID=210409 RepID=A0A5B7IJA1_PORTR|nr:hypothetical protein [Portunus trituberculatus]